MPPVSGLVRRLRSSSATSRSSSRKRRFARRTHKLTDTDGWFLGNRGMGLVAADSGDPVILVSAPEESTGDVTVRLVSYFGTWVEQFRSWTAHRTAQS